MSKVNVLSAYQLLRNWYAKADRQTRDRLNEPLQLLAEEVGRIAEFTILQSSAVSDE